MKDKVKYGKFFCDRYFTTTYVLVGPAKESHTKACQVVPEYKDRGEDHQIGGRYGCQIHWTSDETSDYIFVVWFRTKPDIDTLIHEVNHLARSIMSCVGIPPSDDTEEVESYLEGWLARQITAITGVTLTPMPPP